jgi:asparagine synthase (glutamine-hydrolysing)
MTSADGRYVIIFNGEIYNYKELRKELEQQGYRFRTHSDTEVLLYCYAAYGTAMLPKLRGMFAVAIWNTQKRSLFLARDPYGIKPLYYVNDSWTFRFASQVKALLASPKVSRDPEPAGLVGFFLLGSVPEPFTLHQEIRALPAGHSMMVTDIGPCEPQRYFSISEIYAKARKNKMVFSHEERKQHIHKALLETVRYHFVSDVPVGIFLSSGMDSAAILTLAAEEKISNVQTLTLVFDEYRGKPEDELPLAQEMSRRYGARQHVCLLTRQEFEHNLPHLFSSMDQPTIDGVNTYFISKAAHSAGFKVALSGVGGDEIFGGYASFRDVPLWNKIFRLPALLPFAGKIMEGFYQHFFARWKIFHPKLSGMLRYGGSMAGAYFLKRGLFMPWELTKIMDQDIAKQGLSRLKLVEQIHQSLRPDPGSDFARVAALESSWYLKNQLLRDADWAGMAHSLEIRTPYVDSFFLNEMAPVLPTKFSRYKEPLIQAMGASLPFSFISRKKTGFAVPISIWMQSEKSGTPVDKFELQSRSWAMKVMERTAGSYATL